MNFNLPLLFLILCVFSADCACPNKFVNVKGECYVFINKQPYMWESSRYICQELAPGADLATFSDCTEFDNVIKFIQGNGVQYQIPDGKSYWIGGTDRGMEKSWLWIDLSPMPTGAPFWGSYMGVPEPSGGTAQNCAAMNKDDRYYLHDAECELLAFPLCRVPST